MCFMQWNMLQRHETGIRCLGCSTVLILIGWAELGASFNGPVHLMNCSNVLQLREKLCKMEQENIILWLGIFGYIRRQMNSYSNENPSRTYWLIYHLPLIILVKSRILRTTPPYVKSQNLDLHMDIIITLIQILFLFPEKS